MKKLFLICVCVSCVGNIFPQQNLILFDDFSGNQLNTSLWSTGMNYGPNIDPDNDRQSFRPGNIEISNGTAKLKLLNEPDCYDTWRFCDFNNCNAQTNCALEHFDNHCIVTNISCTQVILPNDNQCLCFVPRHFDYTAGMLFSKQDFKYGTFEISCKLPKYCNPSFWLAGGACCEEIDIFELFECNDNPTPAITVHECLPSNCSSRKSCGTDAPSNSDYFENFHTYRLEWTSSYLKFLIDGDVVRYCEESGSNACLYHTLDPGNNCGPGLNTLFPNNSQMNLIVDIAANDCTPVTPSTLEIDYIKVWSDVPPPCDAEDITVTPLYYLLHFGEVAFTAKNTITTSGNVLATTNQTWSAGNYIELNDGFETDLGANITFQIGDCDASNLRIIPNDNNSPIILQSALPAGKYPHSKDQQEENKTVSGKENNISPNPSSGIFTLMSKNEAQNIEVRDMLGNIVYKQKINNNSINMDIDLSNQPKGIYILHVKSADKVYTEKIVVQ